MLLLWCFTARFKKIIIPCYNALLQDLNKHVKHVNYISVIDLKLSHKYLYMLTRITVIIDS